MSKDFELKQVYRATVSTVVINPWPHMLKWHACTFNGIRIGISIDYIIRLLASLALYDKIIISCIDLDLLTCNKGKKCKFKPPQYFPRTSLARPTNATRAYSSNLYVLMANATANGHTHCLQGCLL